MRFFTVLSVLFFQSIFAQSDVQFTAKASKLKMEVLDTVSVAFESNVDLDLFQAPDMVDFEIFSGPNQVISQTSVNGKQTFKKKYLYKLRSRKAGKFEIKSASMEFSGQQYSTLPFIITVAGARKSVPKKLSEVAVIMESSASSITMSDTLYLTYRTYIPENTRVQIQDISENSFEGFEVLPTNQENFKVELKKLDGFSYKTIVSKKVALRPTKAGVFMVGGQLFTAKVETDTNKKDKSGNSQISRSNQILTSEPMARIVVKP